MPKYNLPKSKKLSNKFITISQAASILKVSADTLRNWEREGKLIPERTAGGARRYSASELYELKKQIFPKKNRKLGLISVSKAAKQLQISADTLRNWENKGLVESYRTKGGARRFSSAEIKRIQGELGIKPLPPEPIQISNSRHEIPKFSINFIKLFSFLGFFTFLLTLSLITWMYAQNIIKDSNINKSSDILGEKTQNLENMLSDVISSLENLQKQMLRIEGNPPKGTIIYEFTDKIYNDLLPSASNAINLGALNNYFKEAFINKIFGKVADYNEFIADSLQTKTLQLDNIKLYSASGNPENSLGSAGDFYFRKDGTSGNSALYFKTSSGWMSTDSQSLQSVYEAGNQLTSLDNKNISINLADTTTDSSFIITLLGADNNFLVNDETSDQTPFVITSAGNIGIGKSDPQTKLHLVENLTTAVSGGISVENDQVTSNIDLFRIISDVGGANNVKARITSDGDLFLDGSITASSIRISSGNADLAEDYNVLDNVEEGDVVVLAGGVDVMKSAFPYQQSILGVISENPGIKLSSGPEGTFLNPKAVALTGRVRVKVSLENGPIERGDFLTSSSNPGVAMKVTKAGPVLGKALEEISNLKCQMSNLEDKGICQDKILVFVNLAYADPNDLLASLSLDDQGNLIIPKIKVGKLTLDTGILEIDLEAGSSSLKNQASSLSLREASQAENLASSIQRPSSTTYYDLTGKISSLEERIAQLEEKLDVGSENLETESSSSAMLTELEELDLTPPDILLATSSAILADIAVISNAEISGKLTSYEAEIKDSFKVLGETILAKTIIAGDLIVDGTFYIENGSIINSIPTLFIQKSSQTKLVDFFEGKITLDWNGNLKASIVVVAEFKVLANKISGSAKIPKGENQIKVENKLIKQDSRILITPTSEIDSVLAVTSKDENEGFVVSTAKILPEDTSFDWWVIGEVKE